MSKQINLIMEELINNENNLSFDSIINKYSDGNITIIKEIEKYLNDNNYVIESIDPVVIKKV